MKSNRNVYATLGASNHSKSDRAKNDLYCTHPDAVEELLKVEVFCHDIWEPCDGLGHISDCLMAHGHNVRRSDLLTRGRNIEPLNFLSCGPGIWDGDIITNPPYSCASEMVRKALEVIRQGHKVAMWLRILFLESLERKRLFADLPPSRVWISSRRIPCGKNGHFEPSAQGYAWFIWEKGRNAPTTLHWL